jgi:crossover junction endodeoxyribonuclease RuvC
MRPNEPTEEVVVRVLGVDPGLTRCGVGVVEGSTGRRLTAVAVHVVRTSASTELGERLLDIDVALDDLIGRYEPDAVAVERVFSQHNVRTVMGTAQVSGLAIVAATRHGVPVALHTPSEVKAAVTGSGRADKAQVTAMVTRLLRLSARPSPPDAADALALAMCCIWRGTAVDRLAVAGSWGAGGSAGAAALPPRPRTELGSRRR